MRKTKEDLMNNPDTTINQIKNTEINYQKNTDIIMKNQREKK